MGDSNVYTNEYPDFYFDGVQLTVTVFGVNMTFTLSNPHPKDQSDAIKVSTKAVTRTSLEHAKVFAMLLRKQIKQYEFASHIEIKVPDEIYARLGLDSSDW